MQLLSSPHHVQLPTALPPSPTLTNPDMILPYTSRSLASTSSITPRESQHHSTQQLRVDDSPSLDENGHDMKKGVRRLFGNGAKSSRGDGNKTSSLKEDGNGNLRNGDHQFNRPSRERLFLTPSPTPEDQYRLMPASKSGRIEIKNGHWEGFDGPVEEASEDPYDIQAESPKMRSRQEHTSPTPDVNAQAFRAILDEDEDDPQSHAAMSKRAELILANAKKRLLVSSFAASYSKKVSNVTQTMESNLNRARCGLNSRPSSSMSSFADQNPEPVSLYAIPGRASSAGLFSTKYRQPISSAVPGSFKGHARVFSETSVPSRHHGPQTLERDDNQASSAFGSIVPDETALDPSEEAEFDNERKWFWTGLNRNGNTLARINQTLEPLHEDEPAPVSFDPPPPLNSALPMNGQSHLVPDQKSLDSSSSDRDSPPSDGLTQARSTHQMRDLRDQMQDLKGKISNLKRRAREDSLRRRSLQSLRTPSPFTAAEQWYTGASGQLVKHSHAVDVPVEHTNEENIDNHDKSRDEPSTREVSQDDEPAPAARGEDEKPNKAEDGLQVDAVYSNKVQEPYRDRTPILNNVMHDQEKLSQRNANLDLSDEASADSQLTIKDDALSNPADETDSDEISTSPVGERHEDRPDAFDYEHFYLHSSMGHYGRPDISRTSSHSSMYSVETTKPNNDLVAEPAEITDDGYNQVSNEDITSRYSGHFRQNSGESISTVATFATATEGRVLEEAPQEEVWVDRHSEAESRQSDYPLKHNFDRRDQQQPSAETLQQAREIRVETAMNNSSNTKSPSFSPVTPTPTSQTNALPLHSGLDLLSALSGLSAPEDGAPRKTIELNDRDKELVDRLIQSLSNLCIKLYPGTMDGGGRYESRVWRRRIDAARRVLDGETNGEAF